MRLLDGVRRHAVRVIEVLRRLLAVSLLDVYSIAGLAIIILAHRSWHSIARTTLTRSFIAAPGALLAGRGWLWLLGTTLLFLAFSIGRRLGRHTTFTPRRWALSLLPLAVVAAVLWAVTGWEMEFLFAYLLYAGFVAMLSQLVGLPDVSPQVAAWAHHSPTKRQVLLQFEADKYWRGLNILWAASAAGIAALGTYVISGPPAVWGDILDPEALHAATEARVWIGLSLLGAFAPGIVWIVAAIVARVNRIHHALEALDL